MPSGGPMAKATGGVSGDAGTAATHFNDVDNDTDTRLGLFPFLYAGLRIVDLRRPADPVEVAYFKPGDPCASHVHYDRDTGTIWLACSSSGFYTLALDRALVRRLALPHKRAGR